MKPEIETDAARGLVSANFQVSLNRRAKFDNVILKGAPPEEEQRLQRALNSWMARVRGSAIRAWKSYSLRSVQNATQYLESQLIGHDYLGSRVQMAGAEYVMRANQHIHYRSFSMRRREQHFSTAQTLFIVAITPSTDLIGKGQRS